MHVSQSSGATALQIDNHGTKRALHVISNIGASQDNPLVTFEALNSGFDQELLRLNNAGTGLSYEAPFKPPTLLSEALKERKAKREGGYTREQYFAGSFSDVFKQVHELNPKKGGNLKLQKKEVERY